MESKPNIKNVTSFEELSSISFQDDINALCWNRELKGDFSEIVNSFEINENIIEINEDELIELELTEQGKLARDILLKDFKVLKDIGALPTLNLIKQYDRDDSFFSTDVYSFHVDHSPIPVDTFLCTYYGESSEILSNMEAKQKILIPEIRKELKKLYGNSDEKGFESFLSEYFFDLHYQASNNAKIINLGVGNLWKIATENPESNVLPCIHRAPKGKDGKSRLLLIC